MNGPSEQLQLDLQDAIVDSLRTRRPLLTHLNADTSWFLQIPRPPCAVKRGSRQFYNILIDPWLNGSQSDVAAWFSQQWHTVESSTQTIKEVELLASGIELLAKYAHSSNNERIQNGHARQENCSLIDAVAISHEFTDHCHKETLLQVDPDVPVFASEKAASLVRSWGHFRTVKEMPHFMGKGTDWRSLSAELLPDWLSIARLVSERDALYYHSAILIAFDNNNLEERGECAEAVIYTPHGIHAPSIELITHADPPLSTLALLHGLHSVALSKQQLNLGAYNGLEVQRLLKARYWISTHDENKKGGGLVKWFLNRKILTVEEALEKERQIRGPLDTGELSRVFDDTRHVELRNGESKLLALS